ncbi:M23 family metallopeptidase [Microbacterium dauci]|uniref:M23 family metallopeptidase n=1 Tax=Microbacterium dauci TaxID=3048008 RepID=A0ABT6ZBN3_9MICO|nr:M23 family metallopeptidase [Microbacterium sp. LX3-4]MDJ1113100.1 M23 family metallopeptidase [Microbacterium sp. LX3-4]
MAEQFHPSTEVSETSTPSRSSRLLRRRAAKAPANRAASNRPHPVRSFVTLAAVAGMVATVAIPAFVAAESGDVAEARTLQQISADGAQSLVVASEATPEALERGGYSATTPEEIQEKKDKEAAEAAAKAALAARLSSGSTTSFSSAVPLVAPGSGIVRRPLAHFNNFGTPYAGHKGTDYMVGSGEGIYSVADGTVVASSEAGPGWGVYVKVAHNIGGKSVTSLYAHMSYGTRRVAVGDTVSAGQLIGQVGATGRANGSHLHLEIRVNNGYVNAESWLQANAG